MKKLLSLFAVAALFVTTGCGNKKKMKTNVAQEEIIIKHTIEEAGSTNATGGDKKEDYSIVG